MPTTDFASEILETEIVLTHIEDGHVYHFPILSNGIVSLHWSRIEANPKAKCEGSKYLLDARDAAQTALRRSHALRVDRGNPAIAGFFGLTRNPVGRQNSMAGAALQLSGRRRAPVIHSRAHKKELIIPAPWYAVQLHETGDYNLVCGEVGRYRIALESSPFILSCVARGQLRTART